MLDQQTTDDFIGRKREIDIFTSWLGDPNAPWILYFHDALEEEKKKGGVGKTWLLRKCASIASQQRKGNIIVTVDFFNVQDRDGILIAERVVQALQDVYPDWFPVPFKKNLYIYRISINAGNINIADFRDNLWNGLAADMRTLHKRLAEMDRYLLVFFDTFELIQENPVTAVLCLSRLFPDNYQFDRMRVVIAGRNAIDWSHPNWRGREKEVKSVRISLFTQEEVVQYVNEKSIYEIETQSEQASALYKLTEGRPILVGLVTDVLNRRILTLEQLIATPKTEFEPRIVTQINYLEKPINWIILFMAHLYHRFNWEILEWILKKPGLKNLVQDIRDEKWFTTLPTLSFVRRPSSGNDFVLHDEMHRLISIYCWPAQDPDRRIRRELSVCAISYYENEIILQQTEKMSQTYIVEMLYHKLFLNIDDGFSYFEQNFNQSIDLLLTSFARSLLQETQKFEDHMSPEQRCSMKLAEAKLSGAEENPSRALYSYQELEHGADKNWFENHLEEIFYEKGRCYLQLSKFSDAIDSFKRCLMVEDATVNKIRRAEVLNSLGYTYRRQGNLIEAIRYYEESMNLQKNLDNQREYATILNNIGNVYRLQGKIEDALRMCKISLQQRRWFFKEGKASEVDIALSLSTIGQIFIDRDNIVEAERSFQEAFEIYNRIEYKRGIAATYNRLGQIQMAKGDFDQAKWMFEKGYDASFGIDSEARINSLNKKGRVFALQNKWEEASKYIGQAIDLARQVNDYYQQAESLVDLAEVFERIGQHQQSNEFLKEAEEISSKYNYSYLLGRAEELKGDIHFREHEYLAAFSNYRIACRYLALYSPLQFEKFLRKLIDLLLATPITQLPRILDLLISYWTDLKLDESHPELINACKEVSRHIGL